jgi:uncharacterized protein
MTSVIVDRRPQQGKSAANRQRVLRRFNKILKQQVDALVNSRKLGDVDSGAEVSVQRKDASEPNFTLDQDTGQSDRVLPGNDQYRVGDKLRKPQGGGGGGGSGDGDGEGEPGEDSFRFMLSREEFLQLLFDDLELPELLKKELVEVTESKFRRGGIVREGNPGNLSYIRTFRESLGRRVAAQGRAQEDVEALEAQVIEAEMDGNPNRVTELRAEIEEVRRRAANVPFLDPVDLRHRSLIEVAAPRTAAVMFCLMDVSGSMDEERKDLAKRFFTLLYLFLCRKYEKVHIVFIRHTDDAEEVDENTFFHDPKTGGTRVIAALQKMKEICEERFPPSKYNIIGAQASDGDAFGADGPQSRTFLVEELLPMLRYFVYAETNEGDNENTSLWRAYEDISSPDFNKARIRSRSDVYPALAKLFAKENA